MWVERVCNLCICCGLVDAHACNTWLVDCCCLSAVCQNLLFFMCIFDRLSYVVELVSTLGTLGWHVDACVCNAWLVECCCLSVACQILLSHQCIYDRFGVDVVCTCLWFDNTCLFHLYIFDRFGLNLYAICVRCVHVSAHACKALFVDCCCLSVVCPSWRFHQSIYDRFVVKLFALLVQSVGMWAHMFAKLGCGLLLLVGCLSKLVFSFVYL